VSEWVEEFFRVVHALFLLRKFPVNNPHTWGFNLHITQTSSRDAARGWPGQGGGCGIGEGLAAIVPGDCYDLVLCGSSLPENNAFFSKPGTYTEDEMRYMLMNAGEHALGGAFLQRDPGAICISQVVSSRHWVSGIRLTAWRI